MTGKHFGTGFVIYKDQSATYILTCMHVVNAVGGQEELKAKHIPAIVIASDTEDGFDLAVLQVKKVLDVPALKLKIFGRRLCSVSVSTTGWYLYGNQRLSQEIEGVLDEQAIVNSESLRTCCTCWHLEIQGDYHLQPGYSGAPVVDETDVHVLGVVNQRKGNGERGLAISIEALKKIWDEMPDGLIEDLEKPKVVPTPGQLTDEPLMNLENELAAFEKIATGQDTQTRLILVHGESGMGKTHLLGLYKRVAEANNLAFLDLSLGPQISIEQCVEKIVFHFGVQHFPYYDHFLSDNPPAPMAPDKAEGWQRLLTRNFFKDFSN